MEKIFLSFRSSDTQEATRSIYQSLTHEFGKDSIFYFPESNFAGDHFVNKIFAALGQSAIFIAIIGSEYVSSKDEEGNIRIFQEDDLVRRELAFALKNKMTLIPILVGNTPFPKHNQLPSDLHELLEIDFHNIDFNKGYDYGIQKLVETIQRKSEFKARRRQDTLGNFMKMAAVALILIAAAGVGVFAFSGESGKSDSGEMEQMADSSEPDKLGDLQTATNQLLGLDNSKDKKPEKESTVDKGKDQEISKPAEQPVAKKINTKPIEKPTTTKVNPPVAATNYFLSNQKYQVGVFQVGSTELWDFSKTIASYFNKEGLSSSNRIYNNKFRSDFEEDIKMDSFDGFRIAKSTEKLSCLCMINQHIKTEINENNGLTIMTLGGGISWVDIQYNTGELFPLQISSSGTSPEAALQDLKRKFLRYMVDINFNTKKCQ